MLKSNQEQLFLLHMLGQCKSKQNQNLAPQDEKTMKYCRGKRGGIKKQKYYNREKLDHYACVCIEPKR